MVVKELGGGFLGAYPLDVVCVINGRPITRADILENKRRRQHWQLDRKRRSSEAVIRPCFVWTFYNPGFIYGGWWLYVLTAKNSFNITGREGGGLALRAMGLFPCGYLPIIENFTLWMAEFARVYHRPIKNRPDRSGMAPAWAELSHTGQLLDLRRNRRD